MALMKCQECGAEVSSEARACPRCGHDNRSWWGRRHTASKALIIATVALPISVYVLILYYSGALGMILGGIGAVIMATIESILGISEKPAVGSLYYGVYTGDPSAVALRIEDLGGGGWEKLEEKRDGNSYSVSFLKMDPPDVETYSHTVTVYPSVEEATSAYREWKNAFGGEYSPWGIGDEGVAWRWGPNGLTVKFRQANVISEQQNAKRYGYVSESLFNRRLSLEILKRIWGVQ